MVRRYGLPCLVAGAADADFRFGRLGLCVLEFCLGCNARRPISQMTLEVSVSDRAVVECQEDQSRKAS